MVKTAEILIPPGLSRNGGPMLASMADAIRQSGWNIRVTQEYKGVSDLLVLYGVGGEVQADARARHRASRRKTLMWDIGYFGRRKLGGYLRCSIDHDHPQDLLDNTPADPSRWGVHDIGLRDDFRLNGHILLVGLGPKSKAQLGDKVVNWESRKLTELRLRFPKHPIIFRPKPRRPFSQLDIKTNSTNPIEDLLRKCYLVVCRHSNVAVDAVIAGIPIECEDGAAVWLKDKDYTEEMRKSFLWRLSWWQWKAEEAKQAWNFLQGRLN